MAFQDYKPALGFLIPNGSDLSILGTCGRTIISCKSPGIHCFCLLQNCFEPDYSFYIRFVAQ